MNSEWMTTFISKTLREKGLQFNFVDLAGFVEKWSPKASREALSYAFDFFRPLVFGLGFRVSRLNDTQIEILLPSRRKNRLENGELHEAALIAAGLEACKILWQRHAPLGNFAVEVQEFSLQKIGSLRGSLRLRLELPMALREECISTMQVQRTAKIQMPVSVYDDHEKLVAQLHFHLFLHSAPALENSGRPRS